MSSIAPSSTEIKQHTIFPGLENLRLLQQKPVRPEMGYSTK
jgi:hypothetical protein